MAFNSFALIFRSRKDDRVMQRLGMVAIVLTAVAVSGCAGLVVSKPPLVVSQPYPGQVGKVVAGNLVYTTDCPFGWLDSRYGCLVSLDTFLGRRFNRGNRLVFQPLYEVRRVNNRNHYRPLFTASEILLGAASAGTIAGAATRNVATGVLVGGVTGAAMTGAEVVHRRASDDGDKRGEGKKRITREQIFTPPSGPAPRRVSQQTVPQSSQPVVGDRPQPPSSVMEPIPPQVQPSRMSQKRFRNDFIRSRVRFYAGSDPSPVMNLGPGEEEVKEIPEGAIVWAEVGLKVVDTKTGEVQVDGQPVVRWKVLTVGNGISELPNRAGYVANDPAIPR